MPLSPLCRHNLSDISLWKLPQPWQSSLLSRLQCHSVLADCPYTHAPEADERHDHGHGGEGGKAHEAGYNPEEQLEGGQYSD